MVKHFFSIIIMLSSLLIYPVKGLAEYVFTSAPRETVQRGAEIYKPIADYLTKATGEQFVYKHPGNWTEYSRAMQNKEYDLVFDGPHLTSWRIRNINHEVIAKLPQLLIWRIIAKKNNTRVNTLDDLVGKKVCAPNSPNFGMLTMMSHFSNPDRQPVHVITKGWKDGYNGVVSGKCEAAVLPKTNHKKFDTNFTKTKAVHTHLPYPNQSFTAGTRLPSNLKAETRKLLLSEAGQQALSNLRDRFTRGEYLVDAQDEEYEGISIVLKRAHNFLGAK